MHMHNYHFEGLVDYPAVGALSRKHVVGVARDWRAVRYEDQSTLHNRYKAHVGRLVTPSDAQVACGLGLTCYPRVKLEAQLCLNC
jgi:hypothetical protein